MQDADGPMRAQIDDQRDLEATALEVYIGCGESI